MSAHPPGALTVLTRPSMLLLHLAGVLAVVASGSLGLWQYGAWQYQRDDRAAELTRVEPRPLQEVIGPDDPYPRDAVGRPVTFGGRWLPATTVYVEDRPSGGRSGYWVLTGVAVCDDPADCPDAPAVPVVVGWSATTRPAAVAGRVEVTGWLQPPEFEADPDPGDDLVPSVRTTDLLQRGERDLYSAYVILDEPAGARTGLEAVTPDSLPDPPTSTALRNLLYALEWWFFGAFAVYLWVRWSRDELAAARAEEDDLDPEPAGPPRIPSEP
jgi:cytochrome oxidase assembly protein ShyY1